MKLLKLVVVCLNIFISNNLFAQAQDTNEELVNCIGTPELFIIEVTDQRVVHYLWSYEGTPSFYILEYRGLGDCIEITFSEGEEVDPEVSEVLFGEGDPASISSENGPDSEFACPPDVWTIIPGPTLKTSSSNPSSFKNRNGFATAFFKACLQIEFRMKVVCDSDTLYSNVVPYFYDDGNCPDCMLERSLTHNHNTDITIQAGFSSRQGFNFKVMTESCSEP